jgi:hypothetical protein
MAVWTYRGLYGIGGGEEVRIFGEKPTPLQPPIGHRPSIGATLAERLRMNTEVFGFHAHFSRIMILQYEFEMQLQ